LPPRRPPDNRRPPQRATRINEAIRAETVRLIDDQGDNRGVIPIAEALDIATSANLDLVEVAAEARPPVVRVMDYGKWRYEQEQKAKQAKRHQSTITIKEIKFRPKIDPHDYETKKGHVVRFLKQQNKVKVTIMFRGRELLHPERGEAILLRLAEDVKELATIESKPNLDGRNMIMMLTPIKTQDSGKPPESENSPPEADAQAEAAGATAAS
jgi:translation initiation factor IF-3